MFRRQRVDHATETASEPVPSEAAAPDEPAPEQSEGKRGCLPFCRSRRAKVEAESGPLEPMARKRRRRRRKSLPTLETKVQLVGDDHPSPPTQPVEPQPPE